MKDWPWNEFMLTWAATAFVCVCVCVEEGRGQGWCNVRKLQKWQKEPQFSRRLAVMEEYSSWIICYLQRVLRDGFNYREGRANNSTCHLFTAFIPISKNLWHDIKVTRSLHNKTPPFQVSVSISTCHVPRLRDAFCWNARMKIQGCTNPERRVSLAAKCFAVVPVVCGPPAWDWFHITLQLCGKARSRHFPDYGTM